MMTGSMCFGNRPKTAAAVKSSNASPKSSSGFHRQGFNPGLLCLGQRARYRRLKDPIRLSQRW